ncbi:cytosine permease [Streptomyces sp. NBC_00846]|uniref:cytosine permease n=1 Tax=Streptomyces sp. NBC_00846 TaxID=2975849 RepID=UPI00386ACD91|nr:cytosine permease [Streptomyces sp. NBC_00846]
MEQRGVDTIPDEERTGGPRDLVSVLLSANLCLGVIVFGRLPPSFGLGLWPSVTSIVIGTLIGGLEHQRHGVLGAAVGLAAVSITVYEGPLLARSSLLSARRKEPGRSDAQPVAERTAPPSQSLRAVGTGAWAVQGLTSPAGASSRGCPRRRRAGCPAGAHAASP